MIKKIGILGGTFNPIHTGHLLLANGVAEKLKLDYVLFIPCFSPPHKKPVSLVPAEKRFAMVKLAIKNNPAFKASRIEIKRGNKSYSVDTLIELRKIYTKKTKFFFIIGSDSLIGINKWKDLNKLMNLCKLVAVARPGFSLRYKGVQTVDLATLPVSSTDIRRFVKMGRSIRYLVPDSVMDFINKNRLYR